MADLTTIIPAGKKVILISLFGEGKEKQISSEEIHLLWHKILPAPK